MRTAAARLACARSTANLPPIDTNVVVSAAAKRLKDLASGYDLRVGQQKIAKRRFSSQTFSGREISVNSASVPSHLILYNLPIS